MLNLPDLNRLKVFYVVYTSRSLIQAARALNITRSAVSQSLKTLEGEMGTKLFLRDSKKVLPTDTAELLFRSVEPFLLELQITMSQVEKDRRSPMGLLRIGAPQDFGSTRLTQAIVEFRKSYPKISFELTLATPLSLLSLLTDGKLDVAFVDNGDLHAKYFPVSIVTAVKEKFVLVSGRKYFDENVRRSEIRFEDFKKFEFVDYLKHAPVVKLWIKHHFDKAARKTAYEQGKSLCRVLQTSFL
jgi:DNA-binding transcriptional LysR family regulator